MRRKWEPLTCEPCCVECANRRSWCRPFVWFWSSSLAAAWFFNRQAKIRWAREEALPEIERLVETSWRDSTDAYKLAVQAEKYIPNDPKLAELFSKSSLTINIKTKPPRCQHLYERVSVSGQRMGVYGCFAYRKHQSADRNLPLENGKGRL